MRKIDRFLSFTYSALLLPAWSPYFDDSAADRATQQVVRAECSALLLTRDAEDIRWQARHPNGCDCAGCS